MKLILSFIMLIASVFLAQSTFAMNVQVQEALTPPDTFVTSVISAPTMTFEYTYEASPMVTTSDNKLSHLSSYIINNTHKTGLNTTYLTAGFWEKPLEVETVPKFPHLIRQNGLEIIDILEVGLVS